MTVMGDYSGILRKIIHEFKYKNVYTLSELLAQIFIRHIDISFHKFDFITAIPLHKSRFIRRGYNQADVLGSKICKKINIEFIPNVLIKIIPTKPQMSISNTLLRKKNIKGAYLINNQYSIRGKTIGVIDDVTTTGATLFEAARILKNMAQKVSGE